MDRFVAPAWIAPRQLHSAARSAGASRVSFNVADFPDYLEQISDEAGGNVANNLQYLIMRIRTMLSDKRFSHVVAPQNDITFEEWLESYIGKDMAQNGPIAVIDLSLVPSDLLHIIAGSYCSHCF